MSIQARSLWTAVRRRLAPTVAEAGPGVDLDAVVGAATGVAALSAGDAPGVGALDTVADWLGEGEDEVGVDPVMVPDAGRAAEGVDAAVAECWSVAPEGAITAPPFPVAAAGTATHNTAPRTLSPVSSNAVGRVRLGRRFTIRGAPSCSDARARCGPGGHQTPKKPRSPRSSRSAPKLLDIYAKRQRPVQIAGARCVPAALTPGPAALPDHENNARPTSWPTSTSPASAMDRTRPPTAGSNASDAPPFCPRTLHPTTSLDHRPRPADSAPTTPCIVMSRFRNSLEGLPYHDRSLYAPFVS